MFLHTSFCESFLYFFYFLFVLNTCFVNKSISKKKITRYKNPKQTILISFVIYILMFVSIDFVTWLFTWNIRRMNKNHILLFVFEVSVYLTIDIDDFLFIFFFFPFFIFIDKFLKDTIMFCILCYRRKYSKRRSLWCSSQYIFSK